MKSLRFAALGLTCCFSARLNAQEQAPIAPITPAPQAPALNVPASDALPPGVTVVVGGLFQIAPSSSLPGSFNVAAANVRALDLLKAIAAKGDLQLIVADDAPNLLVNVQLRDVTPQRAIESIAPGNRLTWGKVGANTYLLVRAPSPIILRAVPTVRSVPAPNVVPPPADKPAGKPFFFNGYRYYIAPLQ